MHPATCHSRTEASNDLRAEGCGLSAACLRVLNELQHDVGLDALQLEQHVGQQHHELQHPGFHVLDALRARVMAVSGPVEHLRLFSNPSMPMNMSAVVMPAIGEESKVG